MMARCMYLCGVEEAVLTSAATNVLSVVNRKTSERVDKHTDAVLQQIELDTPFFTLSTANPSDITRTTLSNTLHST